LTVPYRKIRNYFTVRYCQIINYTTVPLKKGERGAERGREGEGGDGRERERGCWLSGWGRQ
jgi:hypothetical protein